MTVTFPSFKRLNEEIAQPSPNILQWCRQISMIVWSKVELVDLVESLHELEL